MSPIINKVLRWVYWTHVFVSFCMVCPWWFFYFWKLYSFSSFWSQSSFLAMCLIPAALFLLFRCLALFPALTTFSMCFLDIITRINIVVPGSFVAIWAVTCLYVHLGCDFLLTALPAMCGWVIFFLAFPNAARLGSACYNAWSEFTLSVLGSCTTLVCTFRAVGLFSLLGLLMPHVGFYFYIWMLLLLEHFLFSSIILSPSWIGIDLITWSLIAVTVVVLTNQENHFQVWKCLLLE